MPTWKEAQQPTQTFKGKSSKPNLFTCLGFDMPKLTATSLVIASHPKNKF